MKCYLLLLAAIAGFVVLPTSAASARLAPYFLEDVKLGRKREPFVRLRNRRTGRIVWTLERYDSSGVCWSKDGKALVFGSGDFVVWREGYRLRHFALNTHYWDYDLGFAWSPDNRRLLVRFGASAMADADIGNLFCLKLGPGNYYRYTHVPSKDYVRKMAWRDSRTVLYWLPNPRDPATSKTIHYWRVP